MTRPDADLLSQLLDQHGAALALYAAQWTDHADDCVQEALVELAGQRAVPENARAWLYRVVKHRALNTMRGERRRRQREAEAWRRRLVRHAGSDAGGSAELLDALEHLAPQQREIVILRVWGGLSFGEVALATEISTSSAHRIYEQAIETLRTLWNEPCPAKIPDPSTTSK